MPEKPKTGWIQKLNKNQIIEELIKREVESDQEDNFGNLRELLRETIKKKKIVKMKTKNQKNIHRIVTKERFRKI